MAPDTTYRHMPGKLKINYINGGCGFPQDNQAQTQNERLIFLFRRPFLQFARAEIIRGSSGFNINTGRRAFAFYRPRGSL